MSNEKRPKLQFEADREARWHITGDPESTQARSWMAGYVSALTDSLGEKDERI